MSAGYEEIDAMARGTRDVPERSVVVQPCFRFFDAIGQSRPTHLSLFLMGAALYGKTWTIAEVLDPLLSFLLAVGDIDRDHLWLSSFSGATIGKTNVKSNAEPLEFWVQRGFPLSRAVQLGVADNFWVEGNVSAFGRPRYCGPQIEVFYETNATPCREQDKCRPGCKCGRFLELANVISISFRLTGQGDLMALSQPLCESVVGIERVLMASENVKRIVDLACVREEIQNLKRQIDVDDAVHEVLFEVYEKLRAFCRLVVEGAKPSGKGRGSVLRRLFRSAFQAASAFNDDTQQYIRQIIYFLLGIEGVTFGIALSRSRQPILAVVEHELGLCATRSEERDR